MTARVIPTILRGGFQCGFIRLSVHREQFGREQRFVVRIQMRDCRFYFLKRAHNDWEISTVDSSERAKNPDEGGDL